MLVTFRRLLQNQRLSALFFSQGLPRFMANALLGSLFSLVNNIVKERCVKIKLLRAKLPNDPEDVTCVALRLEFLPEANAVETIAKESRLLQYSAVTSLCVMDDFSLG